MIYEAESKAAVSKADASWSDFSADAPERTKGLQRGDWVETMANSQQNPLVKTEYRSSSMEKGVSP